jgi:hypothetical protein
MYFWKFSPALVSVFSREGIEIIKLEEIIEECISVDGQYSALVPPKPSNKSTRVRSSV